MKIRVKFKIIRIEPRSWFVRLWPRLLLIALHDSYALAGLEGEVTVTV